jgi:outer membrane lipopolysaccharide assembly protein LptE/RlpB
MKKLYSIFYIFLLSSFVYSCSGEPFHLRGHDTKNAENIKEIIYIEGINRSSPLGIILRDRIKSSGASLSYNKSQASIQLTINNINEGKIAAGYSRARKVREYDIFLRLDYVFTRLKRDKRVITNGKVNVIRTQLYDSDFALAKAEEEETIRQELRGNAAHLILTKLRYSNKN